MLITYRGREYCSTVREDAEALALELDIWAAIWGMHNRGAEQRLIDRALWQKILRRTPGSLTAGPVPPGVIACGPGGRLAQLPPEDVATLQEFAALLTDQAKGA